MPSWYFIQYLIINVTMNIILDKTIGTSYVSSMAIFKNEIFINSRSGIQKINLDTSKIDDLHDKRPYKLIVRSDDILPQCIIDNNLIDMTADKKDVKKYHVPFDTYKVYGHFYFDEIIFRAVYYNDNHYYVVNSETNTIDKYPKNHVLQNRNSVKTEYSETEVLPSSYRTLSKTQTATWTFPDNKIQSVVFDKDDIYCKINDVIIKLSWDATSCTKLDIS